MPIKIPNDLPATKTLTGENIFVMTETRAKKNRDGDTAFPPHRQHAPAGRT